MPKLSNQLPLPLTTEDAYLWETFVVSPSNEEAFLHLKAWMDWETPFTLLLGAKGSGKTHLTHVWSEEVDAYKVSSLEAPEKMFEDLNRKKNTHLAIDPLPHPLSPAQQETLFHLYNTVNRKQGRLLITIDQPLILYDIQLKDLLSRLKASHLVELFNPDDNLVRGLLVKNCSQHQIRIPSATLDYLSVRIKRQYKEIHKTTEILIQEALARKSALTIPFVKGVLSI